TVRVEPACGRFSRPPGGRIGVLAQAVPALQHAAIEYVPDAHEPSRHWQAQLAAAESADDGNAIAHAHSALEAMGAWSIPAQAATILAGLGFTEAQQQFPVAHFSGGWRMRLNLARVRSEEH